MNRLLRIARNVQDLPRATAYYATLGFKSLGAAAENPKLATALGVSRATCQLLTLGAQTLELTHCDPCGAPFPADTASNDLNFQHIAILTNDIGTAHTRALAAGGRAITALGPQQLPPEAGGVIAFKFRDAEGHPLEFLQFPGNIANPGYDHSAISISNIANSLAFYAQFGFRTAARQTNTGQAQALLDAVLNPIVDVIALKSADTAPHLELLHYRSPVGHAHHCAPNDLAADRLVMHAPNSQLALQRDPDGHVVLLEP
jgi:catechol 2,3-dioxygenase-like lactoylglutathione lyase family enzyme